MALTTKEPHNRRVGVWGCSRYQHKFHKDAFQRQPWTVLIFVMRSDTTLDRDFSENTMSCLIRNNKSPSQCTLTNELHSPAPAKLYYGKTSEPSRHFACYFLGLASLESSQKLCLLQESPPPQEALLPSTTNKQFCLLDPTLSCV